MPITAIPPLPGRLTGFQDLPIELQSEVSSYLMGSDALAFSQVNSTCRELSPNAVSHIIDRFPMDADDFERKSFIENVLPRFNELPSSQRKALVVEFTVKAKSGVAIGESPEIRAHLWDTIMRTEPAVFDDASRYLDVRWFPADERFSRVEQMIDRATPLYQARAVPKFPFFGNHEYEIRRHARIDHLTPFWIARGNAQHLPKPEQNAMLAKMCMLTGRWESLMERLFSREAGDGRTRSNAEQANQLMSLGFTHTEAFYFAGVTEWPDSHVDFPNDHFVVARDPNAYYFEHMQKLVRHLKTLPTDDVRIVGAEDFAGTARAAGTGGFTDTEEATGIGRFMSKYLCSLV